MMDLSHEIHFVVGAQGKPTAVLVDISTWEQIMQALEDAEDINLARQALAVIEAAGGNLDQAGMISWKKARKELEQMDDAKA